MTDDLEKRRAAYREALDAAMLILKGEERAEEVKLEARLYDAFMQFPTLKAKKAAVETLEGWVRLNYIGDDE